MKKTAILMILVLLLTAPVSITAQTCDLRQAKTEMTAKTGIYELGRRAFPLGAGACRAFTA